MSFKLSKLYKRTKPGSILLEALIAMALIALILPLVTNMLSTTLKLTQNLEDQLNRLNEGLYIYTFFQEDFKGAQLLRQSETAFQVHHPERPLRTISWVNQKIKWHRHPSYRRYLTEKGNVTQFKIEPIANQLYKLHVQLHNHTWIWILS